MKTIFRSARSIIPIALLFTAGLAQAIALPGAWLFPESISITPDGIAFVGSMTGGVLRVSMKTGHAETWIKPGAYGSGSLFGVLVDSRNHMLWVCTNDYSDEGINVQGAAPGAHQLEGFDLRTGQGRIHLPLPGKKPICNDITVAKNGTVYVSDSASPQILRWRPGMTSLEVWVRNSILDSERGGGLDGIAFGGDGNLYLTNFYSGDLYRVAVRRNGKAGKITRFLLSRPLVKPDGMRIISGTEFALTEGGGMIDRVIFSGDHADIRTLVAHVQEPTGVELYGKSIWYVQGYSTWLFDPAHSDQPPKLPFRLTPIRLAD